MFDKMSALLELRPKAKFHIEDDTLTWLDTEQTEPTEKEINDKIAELQADYDVKKYQRDRSLAFDPIPEQLDQIYHDIDAWKARIKAVKDKFPKP